MSFRAAIVRDTGWQETSANPLESVLEQRGEINTVEDMDNY